MQLSIKYILLYFKFKIRKKDTIKICKMLKRFENLIKKTYIENQ